MTKLHNIEKLAGKTHHTGYATVCGKPVIYHVVKVKAHSWAWEGRPQTAKIGETWVPSVRGATLAEISAGLETLPAKYPA